MERTWQPDRLVRLLGLHITQTALRITVVVGAVFFVVGIAVNNAIIMVETANQIREEVRLLGEVSLLENRPTAILKADPQYF